MMSGNAPSSPHLKESDLVKRADLDISSLSEKEQFKLWERLALPIDTQIGRYRVKSFHKSGLSSFIYRADDMSSGQQVIVKEFFPFKFFKQGKISRGKDFSVHSLFSEKEKRMLIKNFLWQERFISWFKHPYVVRGHGFLETNGTAYVIMEYVKGKIFWNYITGKNLKKHSFSQEEILRILMKMILVVQDLHKIGYICGDIRPANIIMKDDDTPVMIDLETARYTSVAEATSGIITGWHHGWSRQTDIARLGLLAYIMVTRDPHYFSLACRAAQPILPAIAKLAQGRYDDHFLKAIDWSLAPLAKDRPRSIAAWKAALLGEKEMSTRHQCRLPVEKTFTKQQLHRSAKLPDGTTVGPYRIKRLIANGSTSLVYLAHDQSGQPVAIKEFFHRDHFLKGYISRENDLFVRDHRSGRLKRSPTREGYRRSLKEKRLISYLRHPHIVLVYDYLVANGTGYIVMEYLGNLKLRKYILRKKTFTQEDILSILLKIISAVQNLHKTGYIYGDIHPGNIIMKDDKTPVIIDLDTAHYASVVKVKGNSIYGWKDGWSRQTDIARLGLIAYTMVTQNDKIFGPISHAAQPILPAIAKLAQGRYDDHFLKAIDWSLAPLAKDRPRNIATWKAALLG